MAAGLGFKTFTTGEVLTAADTNGYLMQGINVFANSAARAAAITSPQEGQYSYLKDTNALEYYDGAAWVGAPVGDITAVTAGKGLTGGGSSGDVTVSLATTAKGDLVVGTGASTAGVLSVSSDGSTIVADSSTSTGLRYQPTMAAGKNGIINGGFDIWQRGTSFTGLLGNAYGADRWMFNNTTGRTYSRQTSGVDGIQYSLRAARDSGQTWTTTPLIVYSMESTQSIPYAGKTVTLSYYAKAGANFSAASSALALDWKSGTGTDQNVYTAGYTGSATLVSTTVTLTTSWQRFSHTFSVASTATEIGGTFSYTPVGTAGANDWFEITGVQLEIGSVATNFSRAGGTIQGELAACQRYYWRTTDPSNGQALTPTGSMATTTNAWMPIQHPVQMRVAPTSVDYSNLRVYDWSTTQNVTGFTINYATPLITFMTAVVGSALTQYRPVIVMSQSSTVGYIGLSAEL